jgi:thioredoxin reductase/bacterioferritin-associated ferredoxin
MSEPELVVIGAGPAGIAAAIEASARGVDTLIVDEAEEAGGQVYRKLPASFAVPDPARLGPDHAIGERLRRDLAAGAARHAFGHRVWRIASDFTIEALGPHGLRQWQPRAVVAATGAYERIVPFPGWTEPGVIGLAAATILLKSQQMLPGERHVVAGCGPLLAAVAIGILKAGGTVAAIVDLAGPGDWLAALPGLAARPDLLARGLGWLMRIRAAGVPILHRHTIVGVETGVDGITGVAVQPVTKDGAPAVASAPRLVAADSLAVGHGLVPSTEIGRVLRAEHEFRPERGGWILRCDESGRSSVAGFYACGDGTGIAGAAAAALHGRLAGLAVAADLGRIERELYEREAGAVRRDLRRARTFGAAMAKLMAPRPAMTAAIACDTIVCRCEEVTRAEIDDALAVGAVDLNQLKSWTRAGMGPCQGRMCGEAVRGLAAPRWGDQARGGSWTGRLPLRPIPIADLIGDYRYEDIVWQGNKARIDDEGRPLVRKPS